MFSQKTKKNNQYQKTAKKKKEVQYHLLKNYIIIKVGKIIIH